MNRLPNQQAGAHGDADRSATRGRGLTRALHRPAWLAPLGAGLVLVAALQAHAPSRAAGASPADVGIVCTRGTTSTPSFTLTARTGRISNPDGNSIFMWGYAKGNGRFQYPGPVLCVNQGDRVTVVLKNTLPEPTSIVFPGQTAVKANGLPVAPQFTGGALTSLAQTAATGAQVSYTFTASNAGTFIYESGTNQGKQLDMGLVGALVVRPSANPSRAYARADSKFNPATEFVMLLSQIDPALHQAVDRGQRFDMTSYRPRYFMINGRSFPDTIAPNGASWLPSQPYGSLFEIQPRSSSNPDPALIRYLDVGPVSYPFHPHGNSGLVIGRDGHALEGPAGQDLAYYKFSVVVGPGQTVDALYDWTDVEGWNPSTNPVPVVIPPLQNLLFKDSATYYSGSPYLGTNSNLPVGVTSYNQCGEYYHPMHSHALDQVTNYGAAMGGMLTLMRIDPPGGCP